MSTVERDTATQGGSVPKNEQQRVMLSEARNNAHFAARHC